MENTKTTFRPILFSTPMVQAILENRKTMTRRVVKLPNYHPSLPEKQINKLEIIDWVLYDGNKERIGTIKCPYNIGDVLWVRETFYKTIAEELKGAFFYKADIDKLGWTFKWTPSLFMPKEACRIFLKIKSIKVERLLEISSKDAEKEGVLYDTLSEQYTCYLCGKEGHIGSNEICNDGFYTTAYLSFKTLWESINGKESIGLNPYVFVYEFEQIEKPKDFIL